MKLAGWEPIAGPPVPEEAPLAVMFFSRAGEEASVVLAELPQSSSSLVMVTVGDGQSTEAR
jgi:hypothetical protein